MKLCSIWGWYEVSEVRFPKRGPRPDPERDARNLKTRRAKYDLSERDHLALYEIQDQACAICRTPAPLADLAIDHDHDSTLVRGLLCVTCNTAIGILRDDVDRIRRAADYLEWTSVMRLIDQQLRGDGLTWGER